MKINWVVADATVIAPDVDITAIKNIASIWGSWRTWRGCSTDNVVCNDAGKARELLKRNMQEMYNMYIPESMYAELDRPRSVRLFGGQFTFAVDNQDELIAIHLELAPLVSGGARKSLNRSVESLTKGVHLGRDVNLKCSEIRLFNGRQV